eukprot:PhF_6_TR19533/c1_g1_i1/m.28506
MLSTVYCDECAKIGCKANSAVIKMLSVPPLDLKSLDLTVNVVGAKGLKALLVPLRSALNLERLLFPGNGLNNECVLDILRTLESHDKLVELDFSNNAISHLVGKKILSFISRHSSVKKVNLENTCMGVTLINSINDKCSGAVGEEKPEEEKPAATSHSVTTFSSCAFKSIVEGSPPQYTHMRALLRLMESQEIVCQQ